MKRGLFITLLIAMLLLSGVALCEEEGIETPFDSYTSSYDDIIVMENLPLAIISGTVPTDHEGQLQVLGMMLVDMYDYETRTLNKSADESEAVRLYRLLQTQPGIVTLTAVNEDAVLINGLFAANTGTSFGDMSFATMSWFEYNLEENTLRVVYDKTIEACADAEDFFSEYVFGSTLLASVGENMITYMGTLPDGTIAESFHGDNVIPFFDEAYEQLYHTSPDF